MDDRKSTLAYSFNMGSTIVAWSTHKQPIVSLSMAKVEYKETEKVACEAIWWRSILEDLFEQPEKTTQLICDQKISIQMTENPVFHKKAKNIDI